MAAPVLINVNDFMAMLKAEGLVIVKGDELENVAQARLYNLQRKYMRKNSLTFKQVVDAKLLPLNSKTSIQKWVDAGKFKKGEIYETSGGVRMMMTSAIRRLGYTE
jgi:hypothetical protein